MGAAILYLAAHALTGRQGLVAYVELQAQERAFAAKLSALRAERETLETRAARLRPQTLDLDYLSERARISLAASGGEELVFALQDH